MSSEQDKSHSRAGRSWQFDDTTNLDDLDLSELDLPTSDESALHQGSEEDEDLPVEEIWAEFLRPVTPPNKRGVYDDERHKDLPILKIETKKGDIPLIMFLNPEGDRVMTSTGRNYGPEVAVDAVEVQGHGLSMIYKAGIGTVGLALAAANPDGRFVLFEPNVLASQILDRNVAANPTVRNAWSVTGQDLEPILQKETVSSVVLEADRFSGFDTLTGDIREAHSLLPEGGKLYFITHKKAGAARHKDILDSVFGGKCETVYVGRGGYRVFVAQKTGNEITADKKENQVQFEILGQEMNVLTEAGLFSRNGLDSGARFLLETTLTQPDLANFEKLLDVGFGWGAIGLSAAKINPNGRVVMTDIDTRAVAMASRNAQRLAISDRVQVIPTADVSHDVKDRFDLVLSNPPFHVDVPILMKFFKDIRERLDRNGKVYIVAEKTYAQKFYDIMTDVLGNVSLVAEGERENGSYYYILSSRK